MKLRNNMDDFRGSFARVFKNASIVTQMSFQPGPDRATMKAHHATALACQLVGIGCFVVVVLTHICEARHIFPSMGWGLKHSVGHYLDLTSAILALTLLPAGFLIRAFTNRT